MTVHKKIIVLMQGRYLVEELIPPGWRYEKACSLRKAFFNHAIYRIYESFNQVVVDFIWVVYIP
jgi:hypothetical protein